MFRRRVLNLLQFREIMEVLHESITYDAFPIELSRIFLNM